MVGVTENFNVRITLKLHCGLKKIATKSCVGGNNFLSEATFHSTVGTLFWPLL